MLKTEPAKTMQQLMIAHDLVSSLLAILFLSITACAITSSFFVLVNCSPPTSATLPADGGSGFKNCIGKDIEPKSFAVSFLDDIDGGLAKACDVDILSENQRGGFGKEAAATDW